mmetsp:Transcript_13505/g.26675  ORF Transcript_13505/g.26675 Transcript_13505/m.26675 type:complete len:207 (-) Transcript_13505:950-1570(-)
MELRSRLLKSSFIVVVVVGCCCGCSGVVVNVGTLSGCLLSRLVASPVAEFKVASAARLAKECLSTVSMNPERSRPGGALGGLRPEALVWRWPIAAEVWVLVATAEWSLIAWLLLAEEEGVKRRFTFLVDLGVAADRGGTRAPPGRRAGCCLPLFGTAEVVEAVVTACCCCCCCCCCGCHGCWSSKDEVDTPLKKALALAAVAAFRS